MPPFRLPFSSKKATVPRDIPASNENADPNNPYGKDKPSLALGLKEKKDEPNEFKLSSVTDSGEYMPPSPMEQRSFWGMSKSPSTTSTHRSVFTQDEPFSISRESFDSYRRSFDVSGRSPIIHADSYTSRTSLDSRNVRLSRSAINGNTFDHPQPTHAEESGFEEVGLNDDPAKPTKRSFLSRFGDSSNNSTGAAEEGKTHRFNLLSGRKRGQSGTGAELGSMDTEPSRPASKGKPEMISNATK